MLSSNVKNLHELALEQGTDKASHGFCRFYDPWLSELRHKPINLLEVGIFKGSSLKMWRDYFECGTIFGADISSEALQTVENEDRITTVLCNQEKPEELINLFKGQMFDIIIDDGGHTMLQQQLTLKYLLPRLKREGIFIMEDLHTSLVPSFAHYNRQNHKTTLELLNNICHSTQTYLLGSNPSEIRENNYTGYAISKEDILVIQKSISYVSVFYQNNGLSATSLIKKIS